MKVRSRSEGKRVKFCISAQPGSRVFVAGTFNDWNPTANPLQENSTRGQFTTNLVVPSGKYEYKFIVDGVWMTDPACPQRSPDAFGSENSVLQV